MNPNNQGRSQLEEFMDKVQSYRAMDAIASSLYAGKSGREIGKASTAVIWFAAGLLFFGGSAIVLNKMLRHGNNPKPQVQAPQQYDHQTQYPGTQPDSDSPAGDDPNSTTTTGQATLPNQDPSLEERATGTSGTPPIDFQLPEALQPYQDEIYAVLGLVPRHTTSSDPRLVVDYWQRLAGENGLFQQALSAGVLDNILAMFTNYQPVDGLSPQSQYEALALTILSTLYDDIVTAANVFDFIEEDGKTALTLLEGDAKTQHTGRNRAIIAQNIHDFAKNVATFQWAQREFEDNYLDFLKFQLGQRMTTRSQRGMVDVNGEPVFGNIGSLIPVRDVHETAPLDGDPYANLFEALRNKTFAEAVTYVYKVAFREFNMGNNRYHMGNPIAFFKMFYSALGFNVGSLESTLVGAPDAIPAQLENIIIKHPGANHYTLFIIRQDLAGLQLPDLEQRLLDPDRMQRIMGLLDEFAARAFVYPPGFANFSTLEQDEDGRWNYRNETPRVDATRDLIPSAVPYTVQLTRDGILLAANGADVNIFVRDPTKEGQFDVFAHTPGLEYLAHLIPIDGRKIGPGGEIALLFNQRFDYVVLAVENESWPYVQIALAYLAGRIPDDKARQIGISEQTAVGILQQYFRPFDPTTRINVIPTAQLNLPK